MKLVTEYAGRTLRSLLALLLLAGSAWVHAAEFEQTLAADPDGEVEVRNLAGSVRVSGWDRAEVAILARLESGQDVDVKARNGRILIEVSQSDQRRPREAHLELRVPRQTSLRISAISADLETDEVLGDLHLQTVSGSVDSRGFGSNIEAQTVNGHIRVHGSGRPGRVELGTVNGAIHVENAAGRLELSTVNGNVEIAGGHFERVRLNGVNAAIRGHLQLTDDGRFEADSVSGSLAIRLPADLPARFDLNSFSGRIQPCNGHTAERASRHVPGSRLVFTRGAGTAVVRARSMSGEIALCEPAAIGGTASPG